MRRVIWRLDVPRRLKKAVKKSLMGRPVTGRERRQVRRFFGRLRAAVERRDDEQRVAAGGGR